MRKQKATAPDRKERKEERRNYVKPAVTTEKTLERQVLGSPKLLPGKPGC
jgi:hypothetical protein